MKIKFQDEKSFKEDLIKVKEWTEKMLEKDLSEKELTEDSYKEFQKIDKEIRNLKWISFPGAKIKILSSDGTELNKI